MIETRLLNPYPFFFNNMGETASKCLMKSSPSVPPSNAPLSSYLKYAQSKNRQTKQSHHIIHVIQFHIHCTDSEWHWTASSVFYLLTSGSRSSISAVGIYGGLLTMISNGPSRDKYCIVSVKPSMNELLWLFKSTALFLSSHNHVENHDDVFKSYEKNRTNFLVFLNADTHIVFQSWFQKIQTSSTLSFHYSLTLYPM